MASVTVSPAVLAQAARAFGLSPENLRPYGNGHIHETYAFTPSGQGEASHILQRFNTRVFPDYKGVMANISAVSAHMDRQKRGPALHFLPDGAGRLLTPAADGSLWRCCPFIPGSLCLDAPENEGQMEQCGAGVGRFLALLSGLSPAGLAVPLPDFHNTPARFDQLARAVKSDPLGRLATARDEVRFALARQRDCAALTGREQAGALPLRAVHNDAKMANLLLDRATGRPLCLVDLDTVMPGLAAYDFGEAVRSGAAAGDEDDPDPAAVTFRLSYYAAFARGFLGPEGAGGALTEAERASLPWGPRLMALENGMRFLADYILGDPYYKVDYPTHNLVRCRTQFALTAQMEGCFDEMTAIVRNI